MLSVRNMIAILVTIVILLGVFFVTTLYYPTDKRAKRIAKRRAILEAQVESSSPPGAQAKEEKEMVDALARDINFFKKRNLSPMKGIPDLLEQINRMGDQMNIRFVAVKPLDEEDAPGYRRYPFLIEAKAAYPELVNFVYRMEDGARLSLGDIRIESDEKDPSMHRLQFTLNIFELEEEMPAEEGRSIQEEESPLIDLVEVRRDPFGSKKAAVVSPVPQKPKPTKAVAKKRGQPKLVLMGIVNIAGNRIAIINNKILRPGEVIQRRRIDQIEEDHVILVKGDESYPLYLKGAVSPKSREVKQ